MVRLLPLVALVVAGCPVDECSCVFVQQTDVFEQGWSAVDVVWVVSDAASMAGPAGAIGDAAQAFLTPLAGVQTRTWVVPAAPGSTAVGDPLLDASAGELAARIRAVPADGGPELGFDAASEVVRDLHATAPPLVVVFASTRDDAFGARPERDPAAFVAGLGWGSTVHALVASDGDCGEAAGERYRHAVALAAGVTRDLCAPDLHEGLRDLGLASVPAARRSTFQLSDAAIAETLVATVDDVEVPPSDVEGWTYDPASWTLELHGEAVPADGALVTVTYERDERSPPPLE